VSPDGFVNQEFDGLRIEVSPAHRVADVENRGKTFGARHTATISGASRTWWSRRATLAGSHVCMLDSY